MNPITIRGITYPSQQAAANDLGVNRNTIYNALERGTLDRVGLGLFGAPAKKEITFDGVKYKSLAALSRELGMSHALVRYRIKNNIPLRASKWLREEKL